MTVALSSGSSGRLYWRHCSLLHGLPLYKDIKERDPDRFQTFRL